MDEDHGMPDLEVYDGCHQVLNCGEAVEIPGFPVCCPVTISIGLLFTELPVLHPTVEQPAAWPPSNAWLLFWGTCQGQGSSAWGTSDPSVAACHHRHRAITCAACSPRFILFLAEPCKAAWTRRVVRVSLTSVAAKSFLRDNSAIFIHCILGSAIKFPLKRFLCCNLLADYLTGAAYKPPLAVARLVIFKCLFQLLCKA